MDALEELTADEPLSRDHVLRRIADWHHRIDTLFETIMSWGDRKWVAERGTVAMLEEPMRRLALPPQNLPTLQFREIGGPLVSIVPRVLWIVGTNGRLSMTVGDDKYYIVDTAELFERPRWLVMSAFEQMHREPLDKEKLLSIVGFDTK